MFSGVFAPPFSGWNTLGYETIYASSSSSVQPKDEQMIIFVLAYDETLHPQETCADFFVVNVGVANRC